MIGEIGGDAEERARGLHQGAHHQAVAATSRASPPRGQDDGHAGAIVSGSSGTAQAKRRRWRRSA